MAEKYEYETKLAELLGQGKAGLKKVCLMRAEILARAEFGGAITTTKAITAIESVDIGAFETHEVLAVLDLLVDFGEMRKAGRDVYTLSKRVG